MSDLDKYAFSKIYVLASSNSSCNACTAALQSESLTTNARLSSDEPCAIMMTFTPFFATDVKTLDATPTIPLIPDPMSAIIETSTVTSTFFIILPSRFISSVFTALSRSFFFTMTEMLDSDGLWEIIIMLTPAFARTEKIVAAVPGAPTMLPHQPLRLKQLLLQYNRNLLFQMSLCYRVGLHQQSLQ